MPEKYIIKESKQQLQIRSDSSDWMNFGMGILVIAAILWFATRHAEFSIVYTPFIVLMCFAIFKIHIYNGYERLFTRTLIKEGDILSLMLGKRKYVLDMEQCYLSIDSEKSTYLSRTPPVGYIIELNFEKRMGLFAFFKKSIVLYFDDECSICEQKIGQLKQKFGLQDNYEYKTQQLHQRRKHIQDTVQVKSVYTDTTYVVKYKSPLRFLVLFFRWTVFCGIFFTFFIRDIFCFCTAL